MSGTVPLRRLPGHLWAAARLALGAAPATLVMYGVLAVVAGICPVLAATLLSDTIDALTEGAPVVPTAVGLVVVGLVVGLLPGVRNYLHGRLLRAVGLRAMDGLYVAMERITGLGVLETPAFRDRLQMAQQSGRSGPGQLVDDALGAVESAVTLTAFLGALLTLNPALAALAVAAAIPAMVAQSRLNRRRAGMLWRISGRARRELHYADLLTSLSAAKELRMLGLGTLFRGRMRREMTAVNDEHSVQDGRELRVRSALTTVTAAVAIVGLNGAGKSTLIKLLCRFYDPTRGRITWDGVDIRDLDVAALRDRIGAVFQDFMTYELSAAENVGIGDVANLAERSLIEDAARRAGVHDVLTALPRGYDTMLTNAWYDEADKEDPTTGVVLSGGQWQRVALARAFVRDDRDLLILDEPTAGLDPEAEHELHQRLKRHRAERTSLLISHRLNTIRDADRIVVLADGVVAEEGTHAELLERGAGYARLFHMQADGYQPVRAG